LTVVAVDAVLLTTACASTAASSEDDEPASDCMRPKSGSTPRTLAEMIAERK
jgi:hypothetical protein